MAIFTHDIIMDIIRVMVRNGLQNRRDRLLDGLPLGFISSLPNADNDNDHLISDINRLNNVEMIAGGKIPIQFYLRNASFILELEGRNELSEYFSDLAEEAALKSEPDQEIKDVIGETTNEKVIFSDDLIKFDFLSQATLVGAAVARMIVPRYVNGVAQLSNRDGSPIIGYGTGWLIGSKHLITNHHVVNMRRSDESDASANDLSLQVEGCLAQFDYDSLDSDGKKVSGLNLVAHNKALDYAILELSENLERMPLTLWGNEISLSQSDYFPVNIIQHPGGTPKKIGLRNNLVTRIDGSNLAYFTDTQGGSSGSPVCRDDWCVVGLHKAATRGFGNIIFQGKSTPWVNIGTRIDRIISDLSENHTKVWSDIGADVRQ